jgi:hypothetical protein
MRSEMSKSDIKICQSESSTFNSASLLLPGVVIAEGLLSCCGIVEYPQACLPIGTAPSTNFVEAT